MKPQIIAISFFFSLVMAADLLPDSCSSSKVVCVGEGDNCAFDVANGQSGCQYFGGSTCRVCGEEDLTCHAGKCLRNVGRLSASCTLSVNRIPSQACRKGLFCVGGKCSEKDQWEQEQEAALKLRGRGDPCDDQTQCVGTLECVFSGTCQMAPCRGPSPCNKMLSEDGCAALSSCTWEGPEYNYVIDNSQQYFRCTQHLDCPFEHWCDGASGSCLPGIPTGNRLGANCIATSTTGHRQCGEGLFCRKKNPFEANNKFNSLVCQWQFLYSKKEGERCLVYEDCEDNDAYCSSGQVCTKPDLTHLGEGCKSSAECGRGLSCSCPDLGDSDGGRERCSNLRSPDVEEKKFSKTYTSLYRQLVSCTTKNKCTPLLLDGIGQTRVTQRIDGSHHQLATHCAKEHCSKFINKIEKATKDYYSGTGRRADGSISDVCSIVSKANKQYPKYEIASVSGSSKAGSMTWYMAIALSLSLFFL